MSQAIVFTGVDTPTVQPLQMPGLAADEVLVETAYSCISPGTEMRCLAGKQDGLSFPFIPGYSMAGTIAATGANVTLAEGTPVFCTGTIKADHPLAWGGHVSHAIQKVDNVFPLPNGVDLLEASITKIAAISYHGVRFSRPLPHEKVVVIGLGVIGQFAARLHAITGAHVLGVDLSKERVEQLQAVGVDGVTSIEQVRTIFPDGVDIIVDATGAEGVIPHAIELAHEVPWDDTLKPATRYVVQGSYPDSFSIPYQSAFVKQLSFWLPRDCQPQDFRTVLDLVARQKLSVRDLISEVAAPVDAPRIYRALQNREISTAAFEWQT